MEGNSRWCHSRKVVLVCIRKVTYQVRESKPVNSVFYTASDSTSTFRFLSFWLEFSSKWTVIGMYKPNKSPKWLLVTVFITVIEHQDLLWPPSPTPPPPAFRPLGIYTVGARAPGLQKAVRSSCHPPIYLPSAESYPRKPLRKQQCVNIVFSKATN